MSFDNSSPKYGETQCLAVTQFTFLQIRIHIFAILFTNNTIRK